MFEDNIAREVVTLIKRRRMNVFVIKRHIYWLFVVITARHVSQSQSDKFVTQNAHITTCHIPSAMIVLLLDR